MAKDSDPGPDPPDDDGLWGYEYDPSDDREGDWDYSSDDDQWAVVESAGPVWPEPEPEPDPPPTIDSSTTIEVEEPLPEPAKDGSCAVLPDGFRATDSANSTRLARLAQGHIRYVHAWGKWIVYEGGAWRIDNGDALITELAKGVPRRMFGSSIDLTGEARDVMFKWASKSESAGALASMIKLARGIPGVIVDHHDLDSHPWLLNCANGTVDLRTGELGPHDPHHLITCQSPTEYDPGAEAPLWKECLDTWQPDSEVRDYLQRVIGSAASGHPVEHVFVNLGPGANGKGKFYGAIEAVLGADYAVVPHKSLLIVQRHEQHDTVKARLFGARMAVAGETEAGDRIDEAKVKELTGGDLLEARRMREDPWQFSPSHTLFLHTNYRPKVRGGDEGIWRRIRLVPWDVTIPAGQRDPLLAEKLAQEAPGILNWIIAGCRGWQVDGFGHPEAVAKATETYRAEEDHVGRFLSDCCVVDESMRVAAAELRTAYEDWCEGVGETPWSAKAMGPHLLAKGLDRARQGEKNRWFWMGVGLTRDVTDSGMF